MRAWGVAVIGRAIRLLPAPLLTARALQRVALLLNGAGDALYREHARRVVAPRGTRVRVTSTDPQRIRCREHRGFWYVDRFDLDAWDYRLSRRPVGAGDVFHKYDLPSYGVTYARLDEVEIVSAA